jgi:hypothetical protein
LGEKGSLGELAVSRTASKTQPVAAGTRFSGCGLMNALARLGWFGSIPIKVPVGVPVKGRRRLRVGGLGRGGLGFRGGNGIAWLFDRGLRLLAEPLRAVYLWLDGRGRGLRPGWRKATVIHGSGRDQAFDGYDHR